MPLQFWLLALALTSPSRAAPAAEPFRFHLFVESQGVDPELTHSANGDYLFHLIYRGLFTYQRGEGLRGWGAKGCARHDTKLICALDLSRQWSSGRPIKAEDYIAAFRRVIDPKNASPQAGSISTLLNAEAILAGRAKVETLGIRARDHGARLEFEFAKPDPEFEYKLVHPALSAYPPGGFPLTTKVEDLVTSGPYRITAWKRGAWIKFEPNKFYVSHAKRPKVEAWFVEDDSTALRLFEAGKLNFLRRLVASEVARYKSDPSFRQIPMARFDYVGFGPELRDEPELRDALVHGVEFETFMKLFETRSPPGSPSLPARFLDQPVRQVPDLARVKAMKLKPRALEFFFSRLGGDDIARAAEWFQNQWNKNVGVHVELRAQEQGGYLSRLRSHPPAIFRKGVNLDRPTCMAGLEIFTQGHPENYIAFADPEYDRLTKLSGDSSKSETERKTACRLAVERLLNSNRLIPLGEMYFTILADKKFRGWELNELNQLDVSELEATPGP